MARADKPVESSDDILTPVTVKVGAPDDEDMDEGGDNDDVQPTPLGSAEAEGREQRQTADPSERRQQGEREPGQRQRGPKPSSWKGLIEKLVSEKTAESQRTIQQLQQTIAQMNGRWEAIEKMGIGRQGGEQQAGPSAELSKVQEQMRQLTVMAATPDLTPEQRQAMAKQWDDLEAKRFELVADQVAERKVQERMKAVEQNQPSYALMEAKATISREFGRLDQDQTARAEAGAYYNYLVAKNGGVESMDLLREACQYIYTQRGWAPSGFRGSQRERGMWEGTGGGNGRSNGSSGAFTFDPQALRIMQGSGVSPEQVAEEMARLKNGR